jgi:hypothetical protein
MLTTPKFIYSIHQQINYTTLFGAWAAVAFVVAGWMDVVFSSNT